MTHTPTPWVVDSRVATLIEGKGIYPRYVTTTGGYSNNQEPGGGSYENEANAALIVKAVNRDHLFDELVEALGECKSRIAWTASRAILSNSEYTEVNVSLGRANDTLAKVKEHDNG